MIFGRTSHASAQRTRCAREEKKSGTIEIATRVVEKITEHCWLLARYPYLGRARDHDLRPGLRSFPINDYLIIYRVANDDAVLILHVVHGSRDIVRLFGD